LETLETVGWYPIIEPLVAIHWFVVKPLYRKWPGNWAIYLN